MAKQNKITNDEVSKLIRDILFIDPVGYSWKEFVAYAVMKENYHGQKAEDFLKWAVNNGFDPIYWNADKLKTLYPQAFRKVAPRKKPSPPSIVSVDKKKYVPMPDYVKPKKKLF